MPTMQRTPQWLVRALGLLAGEAPQVLDPQVMPVVDIHQGGAGAAEWTLYSLNVTQATLLTTTVLAADKTLTRLVQMSLVHSGGVGTADIRVQLTGPNSGAGSVRLFDRTAVASTDEGSWRIVGAGMQWWIVPPDFALQVRTDSIDVGDSVQIRALIATVPAGSKIW